MGNSDDKFYLNLHTEDDQARKTASKRIKALRETDSILMLTGSIRNQNVGVNLRQLLTYYARRANRWKFAFYTLSILIIILDASIPVINIIPTTDNFFTADNIKLIVSSLAALSAIITGTSLVMMPKENWIRCRSSAEKIKNELLKFNTGSGEYEVDIKKRLPVLGTKITEIKEDEQNEWKTQLDAQNQKLESYMVDLRSKLETSKPLDLMSSSIFGAVLTTMNKHPKTFKNLVSINLVNFNKISITVTADTGTSPQKPPYQTNKSNLIKDLKALPWAHLIKSIPALNDTTIDKVLLSLRDVNDNSLESRTILHQ